MPTPLVPRILCSCPPRALAGSVTAATAAAAADHFRRIFALIIVLVLEKQNMSPTDRIEDIWIRNTPHTCCKVSALSGESVHLYKGSCMNTSRIVNNEELLARST
jgi:hypothetical protein